MPRPATAATPQSAPLEAVAKDVLQEYAAAYESLDADRVKKIWPAVDVEGLRQAFREMRELKVGIDNIKVLSADGPVVRVSCRVTQSLTPRAGGRQSPTVVTRIVRLRRQEAAWLIDGFER